MVALARSCVLGCLHGNVMVRVTSRTIALEVFLFLSVDSPMKSVWWEIQNTFIKIFAGEGPELLWSDYGVRGSKSRLPCVPGTVLKPFPGFPYY